MFKTMSLTKQTPYLNLCKYYLGDFASSCFGFGIICLQFLSMTTYLCIFWYFCLEIILILKLFDFPMKLDPYGNQIVEDYAKKTLIFRFSFLLVCGVIIFLASLYRNLKTLRVLVLFKYFVVFYVLLMNILQSKRLINNFKNKNEYSITLYYKKFSMNWFIGFAIFLMNFMCHPNFVYIDGELEISHKRFQRVSFTSMIIQILFYGGVGTIGYLIYGDNNLITIFFLRSHLGILFLLDKYCEDPYFKVGILLYSIFTFLDIPVHLAPCRKQILAYFKILDSTYNYCIITLFLSISSAMIVAVFPDIIRIYSLFGGIICVYVGWTVPFLIRIRTLSKNKNKI